MAGQDKQPEKSVDPGDRGPAQPHEVEDPHPSEEEDYGRERHPGIDRRTQRTNRPSDIERQRRQ